jgi:ribose transport system permease protein
MLAWFQSSREVAFLLTVVGAATMALTNRYFATASNFDSLQTILAVNGMIALGMMVLLIAGFFDLSVGSNMGLAGIVCAMLLHAHLPIPLAVAAAVLFGATFGLVNGMLVAIIGINPLVATLGTMFVGRGIIEAIATTQTLTGFTGFPKSFTQLGNAKAGGLYFMLWIFLAIAIVTHVALNRFAWGRQFFFLGSNPNAAHSFGFSTRRIICVAYALAGALAASAGVLTVARAETANRYLGAGIELEIIVACLIGGASTSGGRGSVAGAIVGTMLMALIRNSFVLYELDTQWQSVILGAVLIGAVVWEAAIRLARNRANPNEVM